MQYKEKFLEERLEQIEKERLAKTVDAPVKDDYDWGKNYDYDYGYEEDLISRDPYGFPSKQPEPHIPPEVTGEDFIESYTVTCTVQIQCGINFDQRFNELRDLLSVGTGGAQVDPDLIFNTLSVLITNHEFSFRVAAQHFDALSEWINTSKKGWVFLNTPIEEWNRDASAAKAKREAALSLAERIRYENSKQSREKIEETIWRERMKRAKTEKMYNKDRNMYYEFNKMGDPYISKYKK